MWIAKPINALTSDETQTWVKIASNANSPLSQTLRWAHAAQAAGAQAWLIFSPDEKVGGVALELTEPGALECINGPILKWDSHVDLPRQLATFAMSAAKACPNFKSIRIRPRWIKENSQDYIRHVPIPAIQSHEASTLVLDLKDSDDEQLKNMSPRLRRSIRRAIREEIDACTLELNPTEIETFTREMKSFSEKRGFHVPSKDWFLALVKSPRDCEPIEFFLVSAKSQDQTITVSLLIAIYGKTAHYLFGFENRTRDAKNALSASAHAHFFAMREAKNRGALQYDFNGFVKHATPSDPYFGVSEFKSQFNADLVDFYQPEYLIE